MAAILSALMGSKEISSNSLISAIGGNGHQFGIQVGGIPGKWFVVDAGTAGRSSSRTSFA